MYIYIIYGSAKKHMLLFKGSILPCRSTRTHIFSAPPPQTNDHNKIKTNSRTYFRSFADVWDGGMNTYIPSAA